VEFAAWRFSVRSRRRESALPRIRRTRTCDVDRESAVRRSLDPRDQIRRLPRQVHLVNEALQVFTRRGNDWTRRFRNVTDDAWHTSAGSAIVDGESVVPAADGTTDFSIEPKGKSTKIVLVAFDLLYLNSYDLRKTGP